MTLPCNGALTAAALQQTNASRQTSRYRAVDQRHVWDVRLRSAEGANAGTGLDFFSATKQIEVSTLKAACNHNNRLPVQNR